jgi:hypothetical protein
MYELFTGRPSVLQLLAEGKAEGDFADAASVTMEQVVRLLCGSGLDRQAAARAAGTLIGFTIGSAMRQVRECHAEGGLTAQAELMRHRFAILSPERHPALIDLAPELTLAREDGQGQYTFGLGLILCGLRDLAAAAPPQP